MKVNVNNNSVNQQILLFRRERGAVLITSLMILVVMTLIGVTAMQSTTLEEKMAGNVRDRDMAFQAAETALRYGEEYLRTPILPKFDGIADDNGNVTATPTSPAHFQANRKIWEAVDWINPNHAVQLPAAVMTTLDVAGTPAYYLEELPSIAGGGSLEAGVMMDATIFRVTARGVGGSSNAIVVLQSSFRR